MSYRKTKFASRYYKRHNRNRRGGKRYAKKPFFTHPKPEVPKCVVKEEPIYRIPPLSEAELAEHRARYACGPNYFTLETVIHLDHWMATNVNSHPNFFFFK